MLNDDHNIISRLRGRRISKAQGLVEFAIILPFLLLLIFVLIEIARVMHAWMAVENGARVGVRYAVTAEYDPEHCGDPANYDAFGRCTNEVDEPSARVDSIHDAAWAGSTSIVRVGIGEAEADEASYFNVIVCDPEELVVPGDTFGRHECPAGEDPGGPGEEVIVVVEFNHPVLFPGLSAIWPHLRVTAIREATVETYRIPPAMGTPPAFNPPTPPPTNTPELPVPEHEVCQDWHEWHGSRGWNNPNYFGGWIYERHGFRTGAPVVNEIILQNVRIYQEPKSIGRNEVSQIIVGLSSDRRRIIIGRGPDEETRYGYRWNINDLNISMPVSPNGEWYRMILLEAWFDDALEGSYDIRGYFYFPEYGKTCDLAISANYEDYVPPADTDTPTPGPSPTPRPPEPTDTRVPTRVPTEPSSGGGPSD
jgi:hypothetical protein